MLSSRESVLLALLCTALLAAGYFGHQATSPATPARYPSSAESDSLPSAVARQTAAPPAGTSADTRLLREKLTELEIKYRNMHADYVELVCNQGGGIAATGAWCLSINKDENEIAPGYPLAHNHVPAEPNIGEVTMSLFRPGMRVLDLGCGIGQYGHFFQQHYPGRISWAGYDGALNVEEFTKGFVKLTDLSKPQKFAGGPFDWVICMEVGEHLPAKYADTLLDNIHRHNVCGAIMSWARPGQGGHSHVNEQPNDWVEGKMRVLGYTYDAEKSNEGRKRSTYYWFTNTFMVFRRDDAPAECNYKN